MLCSNWTNRWISVRNTLIKILLVSRILKNQFSAGGVGNSESRSLVRPVCLPPDPSRTYERQLGIAAGWGITEAGEVSDVLRQVELNIVPNVTCVDNLDAIGVTITEDMICTFKGPVGTESICSGDSGNETHYYTNTKK